MPRWLHLSLQGLITIIGAIVDTHYKGAVPPIVFGTLQATLAGINQSYNTDGTPQSVPFLPKVSDKLDINPKN